MDSVFNKVTTGVQKLTQQTLTGANKVKDKLQDKIVDIQTQDDVYFGHLWEPSEDVNSCRTCSNKIKTRKHHCRSCGGVYCDECCPGVIPSSFELSLLPEGMPTSSGQALRLCVGCRRGECPSQAIKRQVRTILDRSASFRNQHQQQHKHLEKVNAKVNEAMGAIFNDDDEDDVSVLSLRLSRGSFYGENGGTNMAGNRSPAVGGYFEFFNKSSEIVAIKVGVTETDVRAEIARPSYVAVPPQHTISGFFNKRLVVHVYLLMDNKEEQPSGTALVYDTSGQGVHPERISPSARIDNFRGAKVVTFRPVNKNILLKYKGNGFMEPRKGDAISRVGLWNRLQGNRFATGKLDYSTNVDSYEISYVLQ